MHRTLVLRNRPNRSSTARARLAATAFTASALAALGGARAADVNWTNANTDYLWDLVSPNWSTGAWNNAAGDGAIFGATGTGAITLPGPINVNSLNFTVDGYSLNGTGPLNFVTGTSTQTTGVVNVGAGANAAINVPISSTVGFQKIGAGTLTLSAPSSFGGGIPLTSNGLLRADLIVGGTTGSIASGVLRVTNSSVIPASTRVSIGNGYLDIGGNNVTISQLIFPNVTPTGSWNTAMNANNGVIGSGTLRVTGEINVIGVSGGGYDNTIAANLDLGGGTQVVRCGLNSFILANTALMFNGSLSNGSLLKTIGYTSAGVMGSVDGIALNGDNTYTGATIINSGSNIATGTNASKSIEVAGIPGGPAGGYFSLQGARGAFQSATLIQALAGGEFRLDNNTATGASGTNQPNIPAAQNNDRIRDDAELQLRDGVFTYRGFSTAAASETFGSLHVLGGFNTVTLTANGTGGTAVVTVANDFTLASRATLLVSSGSLSAASKLFINGPIPSADATGILPRMVGTSDFLTYSAATGVTPYTGYATDFSTAGTNVAVTAASTVASSVSINALKRTGSFITTINSGQTLSIASGMILNTSGTGTFTGGTVNFGSVPGVFFGGTDVFNSAVTGSAGLLNANSTVTLQGDLSGLSGGISTQGSGATTTLNTDTYSGALDLRAGTLAIKINHLSAGGAITIGVAQNDTNLFSTIPVLNISSAGANAVIDRAIIVDNGSQTAAGAELSYSLLPKLQPLSNATGTQTLTGNITLNSPLNLQGGAGGGSGATVFTGNVSGPAQFVIPNGRAIFTGNLSNAGGFLVGDTGFTSQVTFAGTAIGSWPIRMKSGNNIQVSYKQGALSAGSITSVNAVGSGIPSLIPLENSVINNQINLVGDLVGNVGAGITAEWAGQLTGLGNLYKFGTGTLILSSALSTHGGNMLVSAGMLEVDSALPSASVTVASTGTLGGIGILTGAVTVNGGGFIDPGNSIGTLATGSLSLLGTMDAEINLASGGPSPAADLLNVTGSVNLNASILNLVPTNVPGPEVPTFTAGTYLLIANDGADPVAGSFSSISGIPAGWIAFVDYGSPAPIRLDASAPETMSRSRWFPSRQARPFWLLSRASLSRRVAVAALVKLPGVGSNFPAVIASPGRHLTVARATDPVFSESHRHPSDQVPFPVRSIISYGPRHRWRGRTREGCAGHPPRRRPASHRRLP